jgi:hypothetical protein
MNIEQIKTMQRHLGVKDDGKWGPLSQAACKRHLRSLMPDPNPWPASDDVSMTRFYGRAGDESNLVNLPVNTLGVAYNGLPVSSIRCHERIADALLRVIQEIAAGPHAAILARYAGCYNHRAMRNGSRPSKHAWGAAIDLDPDRNGLHTSWPETATMPLAVAEAFAREGFQGLGWLIGRDAMHFEACR